MRERAFEPFYTTKEAAKGSGLGLSQVYGLARQSGGTARIESKPGAGTRVEIILPASDAAVVEERVEVPRISGRAQGTVLVVDDQEDVLTTLAEQLQELGYRPITASDPGAALQLLGTERIDLAIIDYVMPGVERGELAHTGQHLSAAALYRRHGLCQDGDALRYARRSSGAAEALPPQPARGEAARGDELRGGDAEALKSRLTPSLRSTPKSGAAVRRGFSYSNNSPAVEFAPDAFSTRLQAV